MLRSMMKTENIMKVIIVMPANGVNEYDSELDCDEAVDRWYSAGLGSGIFDS